MKSEIKEYERRTKDDEQARRLASLLVGFLNSGSIPSSRVRELWYSNMSPETFMRTFQRDRKGLLACGVAIESTQTADAQKLWSLNRDKSLADPSVLSTDETILLDILCTPLVSNPAFAYRNELSIALAKANRSFANVAIGRTTAGGETDVRTLDTLMTCLSERRPVKVAYVDARGVEKNRTLGLLGTFGLRDNTYFVASTYDVHEKLLASEPHTYRLDRFRKVSAVTGKTYEVPKDFNVGDYVRLPFQMGTTAYIATFDVSGAHPSAKSELSRAMAIQGTTASDGTWEVAVSDTMAASAWAISMGITPISPIELVEAWDSTLREAMDCGR